MNRHDEVLLLCHQLGAEFIDDFKVVLPDTSLINFTYHVDGLGAFRAELKRSKKIKLFGETVPSPAVRTHLRQQTGHR